MNPEFNRIHDLKLNIYISITIFLAFVYSYSEFQNRFNEMYFFKVLILEKIEFKVMEKEKKMQF